MMDQILSDYEHFPDYGINNSYNNLNDNYNIKFKVNSEATTFIIDEV
jgi:hypothetical protein